MKLRQKRGEKYLERLKSKSDKFNIKAQHPPFAGYGLYIEQNPDEKEAEYFI